MEGIQSNLLNTLESIEGSGDFATSGTLPFCPPGLQVKGIGEIGLPLLEIQARQLAGQARKAPVGKGSKTVTDASVRSAWEVDAAQVTFNNPDWANFLAQIVQAAQEGLGLEDTKIKANLYKLLLYQKGDFFLPHKDSEKEKGMFGTLVVGLPSIHAGGELCIRFEGREETVDFSGPTNQYKIPYVAFFADCDHEIKPVSSGYRLALVYNLVRDEDGNAGQGPHIGPQIASLCTSLEALAQTDEPFPIAVLLGHQYTPSNFSRDALKLHDRARAAALLEAADQAGYFARLCLMTHYQMGDLKYEAPSRSRRSWSYDWDDDIDPDAADMGYVHESSTSVTHWLNDALPLPTLGDLRLDAEQVWASYAWDEDDNPIEKQAEGYTGNAGMTLEYWYHYGAIALWPKKQHPAVLSKRPSAVQLTWLDYYAQHWDDPTLEASRTTRDLLERLSTEAEENQRNTEQDYTGLAKVLLRANDEALVRSAVPLLGKVFRKIEAAQWVELLDKFPPKTLEPAFKTAAQKQKLKTTRHLLEVLTLLEPQSKAGTRQFMLQQIEQLPTWLEPLGLAKEKKKDPATAWFEIDENRSDRSQSVTGILAHTLTLSVHFEANNTWLQKMLDILSTPFPRDYVNDKLAPVLLNLKGERPILAEALLLLCKEDLAARAANRPMPPTDWQRAIPSKADSMLDVLRAFMESPVRKTYDYRAAQDARTRMEYAIKQASLDLKMETIRVGSPHTLRLTKTQASYEAAFGEWQEDVKLLERLSGI